jgi:hypothetical protein
MPLSHPETHRITEGIIGAAFEVHHGVGPGLQSIEKVLPVHKAQVLTYLRMTDLKVGLLFNFNTTPFTGGIHRISL